MKWSGALFKAHRGDFELDPLSFTEEKRRYGSRHLFNHGMPVEHVHSKHHMVTID